MGKPITGDDLHRRINGFELDLFSKPEAHITYHLGWEEFEVRLATGECVVSTSSADEAAETYNKIGEGS